MTAAISILFCCHVVAPDNVFMVSHSYLPSPLPLSHSLGLCSPLASRICPSPLRRFLPLLFSLPIHLYWAPIAHLIAPIAAIAFFTPIAVLHSFCCSSLLLLFFTPIAAITLIAAISHRSYCPSLQVDDEYNAWLIEINSSPACDYSTNTTSKYVQKVTDIGR